MYKLCDGTDTPVLVDEIQSCMWYGGMFLFRKYGLHPDFTVCGKGFPGGEYPASRLITTSEMDTLNQFGALVTNGQEELASLAYLITMRFSRDNSGRNRPAGRIVRVRAARYRALKRRLTAPSTALSTGVNGIGHCAGLRFSNVERAAAFTKIMNEKYCIDTAAQLYKPDCPPVVLFKPPLIAGDRLIGFLLGKISDGLREMADGDR